MKIKVAAFTVSEKSSNTLSEDNVVLIYLLKLRKTVSIQNSLTVLPAKSDSDVMFCLQSYQL